MSSWLRLELDKEFSTSVTIPSDLLDGIVPGYSLIVGIVVDYSWVVNNSNSDADREVNQECLLLDQM